MSGDMMRHILLFFLVMQPAMAMAAPQFSQAACQQLNDARREVRKQLRQPYTAEQGTQLHAREKDLLRILKIHCKQPVKEDVTALALP
jgi:hypothetical protein